jgi:ssDNA-binding Zn-finger/Zn-ribbon topoisomerase 1
MLEIGIKICKNHPKQINYPLEYRECPVCGSEKIIKIVRGTDK